MNVILLSGGSGKRLWPLSNDVRSKQFIKIFKNDEGKAESMVQHMYRKIMEADMDSKITIACPKTQISSIRNQLGEDVGISVEPSRRDTFPAIVLAAEYLKDIKHVDLSEPIVVCPVDPCVDDNYFLTLKTLSEEAKKGKKNLILMGIVPTYPSEKYGYIMPSKNNPEDVEGFKEKPAESDAKKYIEEGALWNGGVFAFKLKYLIDKAHELLSYSGYDDLYERYEEIEKISFDYAVVEKEKSIGLKRFSGKWKDLGTWNTFTEEMEEAILGNGVCDNSCKNVHIVNELDVPVLAMGLSDVVISASQGGILVSDKDHSSYIKPYVDSFDEEIRFAEKSWGSFKVIEIDKGFMTIKVTLNPGHSMNYHSHQNRNEVWVIASGKGKTIVDGMVENVSVGDVITMSAGCKHTIIAESELKLIEVQLGEEISVSDKEKYHMPDEV